MTSPGDTIRWLSDTPRLEAPVMVGVGAAFDFHAGLVPQAPRGVWPSSARVASCWCGPGETPDSFPLSSRGG